MNPLPKPLAHAIIGLVTLVWAVNFAAQFFVETYKSDPLIHGIFTAIVGGVLALSRKPPGGTPPDTPPAPPQVAPGPEEPPR
jgi:hypothetical protein